MKLYYREIGQGEPFIILHGLLGCSDYWIPFAKKISTIFNFKCIIPDLRNHGNSINSDDFSIDDLSNDIAELIEDLKIEKTHIMGHSLGGKIILNLIAKYNFNFKSIIIIDIANKKYPIKFAQIKLIELIEKTILNNFENRNQIVEYFKKCNIDDNDINLLQKNIIFKNKTLGWKINIQAIKQNLENILQKISLNKTIITKTLLIKGENSDYINTTDLEFYNKTFANFTFKEIKNANHWVHIDNFDELFCEIENFILK